MHVTGLPAVVFAVVCCVLSAGAAASGAGDPLAPKGDEMLLFQELPSVYGASKYDQKVSEAPSSVSIVTADEIKRYGYRTLAAVVKSLRGFYATYDRNYQYLGTRGFGRPGDYNTRFLLLVDGIRVNDNIYDTAFVGNEFPVDLDLIDRIEVVRGPSSSLYGTSAFFGVIHVITKRGRDYGGLQVSGAAGSYQAYRARASYGQRFPGGFEGLVSGTGFRSHGHDDLYYEDFDDPSTNDGHAENADGERVEQLFGKWSLGDVVLEAVYGSREKEIPTAPWGTVFNDDRTQTEDRELLADLKYEHTFGDLSSVTARIGFMGYWYDGDYLNDYGEEEEPFLVVNKDESVGYAWSGEAQYVRRFFDRHKVVAGAEVRRNYRQDQKNSDFEVYLDSQESSTVWAVYAQDEIEIFDNLRVYAGVRHDYYSTFGGSTNPRLALIYAPWAATTVKLLYGQAFRAPNAYELYYADGGLSAKAPEDLQPERIRTYELAVEQSLGEHLRGAASAFYYRIDDLITQTGDPADLNQEGEPLLVFANVDRIDAWGLEWELEGKWQNGLGGRISYAYQLSERTDTGGRLSNSPRHLAKLNLLAPLIREVLSSGLEVQYTSSRRSVRGESLHGFFLTNLTLFSGQWVSGLEVSASVYNLFDQVYEDPGSLEHVQEGIEQDGRNYRIKLSYLF